MRLDAIEATIGCAPTLTLYSGAKATACNDADPSGALVTMTLLSDWLAAASGASKHKANTWSSTASGDSGTAPGMFRIKAGATCHIQGTAGVGSGECSFNAAITSGQTVTVASFTVNAANTWRTTGVPAMLTRPTN